jgi:hypothetical protein
MALFDKGHKGGGRRQGARNRISTALLTAFAEDFENMATRRCASPELKNQ